MYFLSQTEPPSQTFLPMQTNDQWPCLLCWENGRQKGRAFSLPLFLTNIKKGKPKAGLLWRPFLNIRDGHWSFGFAYRKSLRRRFICDKKYILPDTEKECIFVTDEPPSQRLFLPMQTKWPMTLSLMLRKMAAKEGRPFGLPLFLTNIKRKTKRPAFFGGHFLNIRDKVIGHLFA